MLVLGIETAGRRATVALLDGGTPVVLRSAPGPHSAALLPMIAETLESQGLAPNQLDLIGVASGPGTYTGLRVGVVTAKVLARVSNTPVVGVPTLDAMAATAPESARRVLVALHGYKRRLLIAWFERTEEGTLRQIEEPSLIPASATPRAGEGDAVITDSPELIDGLDGWGALVPVIDGAADTVARLATNRWAAGAKDEVLDLVPTYLRPPAVTLKPSQPSKGAT